MLARIFFCKQTRPVFVEIINFASKKQWPAIFMYESALLDCAILGSGNRSTFGLDVVSITWVKNKAILESLIITPGLTLSVGRAVHAAVMGISDNKSLRSRPYCISILLKTI